MSTPKVGNQVLPVFVVRKTQRAVEVNNSIARLQRQMKLVILSKWVRAENYYTKNLSDSNGQVCR